MWTQLRLLTFLLWMSHEVLIELVEFTGISDKNIGKIIWYIDPNCFSSQICVVCPGSESQLGFKKEFREFIVEILLFVEWWQQGIPGVWSLLSHSKPCSFWKQNSFMSSIFQTVCQISPLLCCHCSNLPASGLLALTGTQIKQIESR